MGKHRLTDLSKYDSMDRVPRSLLDDIRTRSIPRSASVVGTKTFDLEGHGFRRFFVVAGHAKPTSGATVIVIDDTNDYRDRTLMVVGSETEVGATYPAMYPGSVDDNAWNLATNYPRKVYYTGSGYATPTVAADTNYCRIFDSAGHRLLYARDTDGALCIAALSTADEDLATHALMVTASAKLGERAIYTPEELPPFEGGDGTAVLPHDLNNLQDEWHMNQTPVSDDTLPLGKITEGDPPLAIEHEVRGVRFRQPLRTPALTRFAFVEATGNATFLVDDRQDWRDRVVQIVGSHSTSDIRPGQVSDQDNGTHPNTNDYLVSGYTGPGDNDDGDGGYILSPPDAAFVDTFFYADADTGHLYYSAKADGTTRYLNVAIFASPQTGVRSQTTATTELDQPADVTPPAGRLADELTDLGTEGIFARIRADLGVVNVGGKVAAVGDQTGNGNHVVEPRHATRPGLPIPVEGAKGMFGFVHSAVDSNDEDSRLRFGSDQILPRPDWTKHVAGVVDEATGVTFSGFHAMHVGTIDVDTTPFLLYDTNSGVGNLEFALVYDSGSFILYVVQSGGSIWTLTATPASYTLGEPYAVGFDLEFDEGVFVPSMAVRTPVDGLTVASVVSGSDLTGAPNVWDLMASQYMNGHTFEIAMWRESLGAPDAAISTSYISNRYGV